MVNLTFHKVATSGITSLLLGGVVFAPSAPAARIESPTLRINLQGGFAGLDPMDPYAQPLAVLDSTGQLFRPVETPAEPQRTLAPYTMIKVSKATRTKIDALAKAAGLAKKLDAGTPLTADARELSVSFNGMTNVIASYGFGDQALPVRQVASRNKVSALIAYLRALPEGTPTTPTSVVIISYNYGNHDPDPSRLQKPQPPKEWPNGYPPLNGSCVVLSGSTAVTAIASLQSSNVLTRWTSDGNVWRIVARPALPGDSGCGPT
jgi:hypothetical protein